MSLPNLMQYAAFLFVLVLLVKPLGWYMARVFDGDRTLLDPLLRLEFHHGVCHDGGPATDSFQFAGLVVATAMIVVGLGFFPALALGPLVEQLMAH